jgi:DNA-binding protein YbaB
MSEFADLNNLLDRYVDSSDEQGLGRIAKAAMAMRDRLATVMARTATADDPSGLVQATVRFDGQVASVYISPHAMDRFDGAGLGRACRDAVLAAREQAGQALADEMQELSGARPGDNADISAHLTRLRRLTEGEA